jgi:hypothetical protein
MILNVFLFFFSDEYALRATSNGHPSSLCEGMAIMALVPQRRRHPAATEFRDKSKGCVQANGQTAVSLCFFFFLILLFGVALFYKYVLALWTQFSVLVHDFCRFRTS